MAEVYWIHLPEHTDVFSQGYVGVTKYTSQERFNQHKQRAASSDYQNISKAIRKYGHENLLVDTLLIAEMDYCLDIEMKLRPSPFVGWNIAVGGRGVLVEPYKRTEESKLAHSERMKKWWRDNPDHDHSNKGRKGVARPRSPEHQALIAEGKFYNLPFRSPWWINAEHYYQDFLSGITYSYAQKKHGLKIGQLVCMWRRFADGWVPSEDPRWADTVKRYKEDCIEPQTN